MKANFRVSPAIGAAAAALVSMAGWAAHAQAPSAGDGPVAGLAACRAITEDRARLACYDAAASRFAAAQTAGDVVVVDRATVRAARRQAFGFNLPSLDIFGRSDREPRIDRVQLVLSGASRAADGRLVIRTQDGQVWRQIDDHRVNRQPRSGSKADVRRAALGSFFMNIDGQRAIRVRREQ